MTGKDRIHAAAKCAVTAAALCFLGLCRGKKSPSETVLTALALLFCIAGDLFLALSGELERRQRQPQFSLGIVSFAIAHVFFSALFILICPRGGYAPVLFLVPASLLLPVLCRLRVLRPGKFRAGIIVYGVFVGFMASWSLRLLLSGSAESMAGAGGLLFWCSDLVLSFWYFLKRDDGTLRTPFALGGAALLLYWAGIWLICLYA